MAVSSGPTGMMESVDGPEGACEATKRLLKRKEQLESRKATLEKRRERMQVREKKISVTFLSSIRKYSLIILNTHLSLRLNALYVQILFSIKTFCLILTYTRSTGNSPGATAPHVKKRAVGVVEDAIYLYTKESNFTCTCLRIILIRKTCK